MMDSSLRLKVREIQLEGAPSLRVTIEARGHYVGTLECSNHCDLREIAQALLRETISD